MSEPKAVSRADVALAAGWILAIALVASAVVTDTDPYWQIRAGQDMLEGLPLVHPDTWSWAPVDGDFYPNSPAWNLLLALAWNAAASWGLFVVSVVTVSACLGAVTWLATRLGASVVPTIATLVVTSLVTLPLLTPRPAVAASFLILLAIAAAHVIVGQHWSGTPTIRIGLAFLTGLLLSGAGNWLHLSWSTSALVVAAAWLAIWWLSPGLATSTRLGLSVAGSLGLLLGIAAGPYGAQSWQRSRVVVDASAGVIEEWTSPFAVGRSAYWAPVAVIVAAGAVACAAWCVRTLLRRGREDRRLSLATALTVTALPFAAAGLAYARFVPTAVLVLTPLVAMAVSRVAEGRAAESFWRRILALTLAVLAPLVLWTASAHAEPTTTAVNALLPPGCRLFSTPAEAASVLLTRSDVTVWVDGRSDYWGRERLRLAQSYLYARDQVSLVPPDTTCILLAAPGADGSPTSLIDALDADAAWVRAGQNDRAILWVPANVSP